MFNFFKPDFAEHNIVEPEGLVSPEFEILNNVTIINFLNDMENSIKNRPFDNYTGTGDGQGSDKVSSSLTLNNDDVPFLDFSFEENLYATQGITALLDHLNLLLCRNSMKPSIKSTIENAIIRYEAEIQDYTAIQAVKDAIYFTISTPAFTILK